jgi:hypothetical protein
MLLLFGAGTYLVAGARAEARGWGTAPHAGTSSDGCLLREPCRLEDPWLWRQLSNTHRMGLSGDGCGRWLWLPAARVRHPDAH